MFNKIKAIKDLRDQAKKMQNELSQISADGSGSWGKVKVTLDGNQQVLSIEIADELLTDKAKLQDALKEAFNDAVKNIQKKMALKMKDMGGLDALKGLGM
ncbi:YbaB/EbfC family nucleoid-associated protein [Candidatus Uhrbacteria bacterium]|nr:YbaB/EbfC family nucleoid-associated protein [Candidatus Uhrbacteria bacterium]